MGPQSTQPVSRRSRRRNRRRVLAAIAVAVLGALAAGGWFAWERLRSGSAPPAPPAAAGEDGSRILVRLPADDGPHRSFMEWWYYNGHLQAKDGRVFSFHYVYFVVNSVVPYTAVQVALTDHGTGQRHSHQRESPGNPSAGAPRGFAFDLAGWTMAGFDGQDALKVAAPDFAFDLQLTNPGPTVFQGGTGLLDFKEAGSSYYYSRPRMKVEGTLSLGGTSFPVTGVSWFDHQWGKFQPLLLGWDWFSFQLDDGANVMLYQLWDREHRPVLASGTYSRDGATRVLGPQDFTSKPVGTWKSPVTGVVYNTTWKVAIPAYGISLDVSPIVPDCEFDGRDTTLMLYWEGAVHLAGSHTGRGFQEISPPRPEGRK